jgi:hypothetical protein
MLEQTDALTNEVLEPITFVLAYSAVYRNYSRRGFNSSLRLYTLHVHKTNTPALYFWLSTTAFPYRQ